MSDLKLINLILICIGLAGVVGVIIRAIGLSEFVVRFKFHNDNSSPKQLKK